MEYGIIGGLVIVAAAVLYFVTRRSSGTSGELTVEAATRLAARPTSSSTPQWVGELRIDSQGQQGAWLEIIEGPQTGRTFFVGQRILTIGRGTTHSIQLSDRDVSRSHCRISWSENGWKITDMGSGNGTWLNGDREDNTAIKDGDVLRVGATSLRFAENTLFQVDYTLARKEIGGACETATHSMDLSAAAADGGASMKDRLLEITRVTQAARKGLSGGQLLEEISISLRSQLKADRAVILRRKGESWELHSFHHARDLSGDRLKILPDKPLMSRVAGSGEATGTRAFTADTGLMCAIATPIYRDNKIIGVLYADRVGEGESEFMPVDLEYLSSMAGLAEAALP